MRASLIFPGITVCGWDAFGKADAGGDANFVQYGLAYISACAKKNGHSIDLIDLRKLNGWKAFDREIQKRSPGVFGISSASLDFAVAQEVIRRIKQCDSSSTTILGGVHASVALAEVENLSEVDYIITGEGEIAFSELLNKLENRIPSPRVIRGAGVDIDEIPIPDRELFDYTAGELVNPWLPHMAVPFVSILTSRGCPYNCKFCQPAERLVFGGSARLRSVDSVMRELNALREKYMFKSLLIHDDLFTFKRKWVREFCRRYAREGFTAQFTCQARADFIAGNEDLVELMADAGLRCFMIGFESGSQRILDFIGKGTTVKHNYAAAEICHRLGIKIFANYMFGLPTETVEDIRSTVKMIGDIQPDYRSPTLFTPYFGTELYAYCKEHDLLLERTASFYNRAPKTGKKIKCVDYELLRYAMDRTVDIPAVDQRSPLTREKALSRNLREHITKFRELSRTQGTDKTLIRALQFLIKSIWNRWYCLRWRF
jgi:anaerobic magnesium-protoporphyrin IX monomethyl ester cyclase